MRQVLMQRGNHIFIRYCASESVFAGFRRIAKLATSIAIAVAFTGIALPTSSAQAQTARFSVTGQFTPGQTTFAENEEASFILTLDGFPDDQDIATAEVELVVQQITTGFSAPQGNTFEGTFFDIAVEGDNSRAVTLSVGGGSNNRMKAIVAFDPDDSTAGIGQPAVITWTIRPKDIASTQTFRIRRTNNGRVVLKNSAGVAVSRLAPTFLENFTITPVIAEDAVFVTYTYQNGDTIPGVKREEPTNTSEVGVDWNPAVGINLLAGATATYSDGTAYECDAASSGNCQIRFPGGQIANGGPVNATFPEESAPPAPTPPTPPPPVAEPGPELEIGKQVIPGTETAVVFNGAIPLPETRGDPGPDPLPENERPDHRPYYRSIAETDISGTTQALNPSVLAFDQSFDLATAPTFTAPTFTTAKCTYGLGGDAVYGVDYFVVDPSDNTINIAAPPDDDLVPSTAPLRVVFNGPVDFDDPNDEGNPVADESDNYLLIADACDTSTDFTWNVRLIGDDVVQGNRRIVFALREVQLFNSESNPLGVLAITQPDTLVLTVVDDEVNDDGQVVINAITGGGASTAEGATINHSIEQDRATSGTVFMAYAITGINAEGNVVTDASTGISAADITAVTGTNATIGSAVNATRDGVVAHVVSDDIRRGVIAIEANDGAPANEGILNIQFATDSTPEGDETYALTLSSLDNSVIFVNSLRPDTNVQEVTEPGVGRIQATITDGDTVPTTAISNFVGNDFDEGGTLNFTFVLADYVTGTTLGYRIVGIEEEDLAAKDIVGTTLAVVAASNTTLIANDDPRSGTFTVDSGTTGNIAIVSRADNILEGVEEFTFTVLVGDPDNSNLALSGDTHTITLNDTTPAVTPTLTWPVGVDGIPTPGHSEFPFGGVLEGATPHLLVDLGGTTVARDTVIPISVGRGFRLDARVEPLYFDEDGDPVRAAIIPAGSSRGTARVRIVADHISEGAEIVTFTLEEPISGITEAEGIITNPGETDSPIQATITVNDRPDVEADAVTWRSITGQVNPGAGETHVADLTIRVDGGFTSDREAVDIYFDAESALGDVSWKRAGSENVLPIITRNHIAVSRFSFSPTSASDSTPVVTIGLYFTPIALIPTGQRVVVDLTRVDLINRSAGEGLAPIRARLCNDSDSVAAEACANHGFNAGEPRFVIAEEADASEVGPVNGGFKLTIAEAFRTPANGALTPTGTINYSVSGSARRGITRDYTLDITATNAAGDTNTTAAITTDTFGEVSIPFDNLDNIISFTVIPVADADGDEGTETVEITIDNIAFTGPDPVDIPGPQTLTINIANAPVATMGFTSSTYDLFRLETAEGGSNRRGENLSPGDDSRTNRIPSVRLVVEDIPSDAFYADISYQVDPASTATERSQAGGGATEDYTIARPSFVTGSFPDGTTGLGTSNTVTIDREHGAGQEIGDNNRLSSLDYWLNVIDDSTVEPPETVIMNFTATFFPCIGEVGGTLSRPVCAGGRGSQQIGPTIPFSFTFLINDNEAASAIRSRRLSPLGVVNEGGRVQAVFDGNERAQIDNNETFFYNITDASGGVITEDNLGVTAADFRVTTNTNVGACGTPTAEQMAAGIICRGVYTATGSVSIQISLEIVDDELGENDEAFYVNLEPAMLTRGNTGNFPGTPANVEIAAGTRILVTIADSDGGGGPPAGSTVNISSRSRAVQNAILADDAITSTNANAVSAAELAEITDLYLNNTDVFAYTGDFDGLTGLLNLSLGNNEMGELVAGVFDGLTSLERLRLHGNSLTSLPPGIFDDLTNLKFLALDRNSISSLRSDTFDSLTSLSTLHMGSNALKTLPADLFSATPEISELTLHNNLFTPGTGLPVGVFDNILGSLGTITTTYNRGVDNFQIDDTVRAAHFVCSRDDADAIVTAASVGDCLRVSAEQFDTYAGSRFSASLGFDSGFGSGSGAERSVSESTGSLLANNSDAGVAVASRDFNNSPSGTASYTCVFNIGGTAQLGADYFLKRGAGNDVGADDAILPFEGTADASGTSGTLTDDDCGPGATEDLTYNIRIVNDTDVEPGGETITVSLASVEAFNSGGTSLGTALVVADTDAGSTTLTITVTDDEDATAIVDISDRTDAVENAILAAIAATDPALVPLEQLAGITRLEIANGSTNTLADGDFDGLTNLHTLDLSRVGLTELPSAPDLFEDLSRLEILWLSRNRFTTLPENVFDDLVNLRQLSLWLNPLTSLHVNQFEELTNLRVLWIGRNDSLTSLEPTVFRTLVNLRELELGQNSFTSLDANQFAGLSRLQALDISGRDETDDSSPVEVTNLTSLPNGIFSDVTGLKDLRMEGNDLTALRANAFSGLNSLQSLDLSGNALATVPAATFQNLPDLSSLTLTGNGLTSLDVNQFSGLTSMEVLNLDSNALTSLPVGVFDSLDDLAVLHLQGNSSFTAATGLPAGIFDRVLDTLFFIESDADVKAAHFVCSLGTEAANAIVLATPDVFDCLYISTAQLAAFNDTFVSSINFVGGFGIGNITERSVSEETGTALASSSDVGVAFMIQDFSDAPATTDDLTCIYTIGGTATLGTDYFFKDVDGTDVGFPDTDFVGTADDDGTSGIFTDDECAPLSGTSITYNIRIINDDVANEDDETIIITYESVEAFDSSSVSLGFAAIEEPFTLTITITEPPVGSAARIVGANADLEIDGSNVEDFSVQIRNYSFPSSPAGLDTLVMSLGISEVENLRSDGPGIQQEFVSSPIASADTDGAQTLDGNLFNLSLPAIADSNGVTEANRPYLISPGGSGSFLLVVPEAFLATAGSGSDANGANITVNIAAADVETDDFAREHRIGFSGNDGRGIFAAQGTSGVEVVETNAALNTIARSAATGNVVYTLVPAIEGPTASITTTGPVELTRGDTTRMAVTFSASNLTLADSGVANTLVDFNVAITSDADAYVQAEDFSLYDAVENGNEITVEGDGTFTIKGSGAAGGILLADGAATTTIYLDPDQSGSGNESFFITLTSVITCENDSADACTSGTENSADIIGSRLVVDLNDPPTVSVAAGVDTAVEANADSPNGLGTFVITLTSGVPDNAVINFKLATAADTEGTASYATDYTLELASGAEADGFSVNQTPTPDTGTLTVNGTDVTEITLNVVPVSDAVADTDETVILTLTGVTPPSGTVLVADAPGNTATVTIVDPGTTELRLVTGNSALSIGGRNDYTVNLDDIGVEVPADRANADPIFNRSTGGEQIDAVFELEFPSNPNFGPLPAIADLEGDPVLGTNAITGDNYDVFLRSGPVTSSANYDISLSGNVLRVVVKQSRLTGTSTSGGNAPGAERFIFSVIPKGVVGDTIIGLNAYTIVAGGDADDATDRRDTLNTSASGNTFSAVDAPTATLDRVSGFDGTIPTTADTNALALSFVNPLPEIFRPEFAYTLSITPTGNDAVNTPFAGHFEITAPTPNVTVSEITEDGDARTVTITDSRGDTLDTLTDSADAFVALRVLPFTGGNRTFNIALTNVRVVSGSGPATRINATPSNDIAERQTTVSVAAFTGPTASINVTGPQTIELGDSAAGGADTTTFDVVLENIPAVDTNSDDVNIVRFTLDFSGTTATDPVDAAPDRMITANSANNSASTLYYTVVGMDGATVTTPVLGEDETVTFQYDDDTDGVDFVDGNGVRRTTFPFTLFSVDASTGVIVVKVSAISYFQADPSVGNAVTTPTVQLLDDDSNALNLAARTIAAVATGGAPSVSIVAGTDNDNIIREGTTTTDFTVELNNIPTFVARSTATFVDVELSADTANGSLSFNRTSGDGTITMGGAGEFTLTPPSNDTVFINTSDNSQTAVLRMPITTGGDDEATITIGAGSNLATADPFISLAPTGISWRMGTDGADAITGGPAVHRAGRQQFIVDTVDAAARIEADELTVIKGTNGEFTVTMEGFDLIDDDGEDIVNVRIQLHLTDSAGAPITVSGPAGTTGRTFGNTSNLGITYNEILDATASSGSINAMQITIPRARFRDTSSDPQGYEQVTFAVAAPNEGTDVTPVGDYNLELREASSFDRMDTAVQAPTPDPGDLTLSVVDPLGATLTVNSGTSIAESTSATVADFVIAGIPPRANRPEETTAMRASFVISSTVNGSRVPLDSDDNLANFEWELIRDVDDLPEEFRATPTADICIPLIGNEATSRWDVAINREAAGDIWMGEEIVTIAVTGISYLESGDCASNPVSDVPDIPALTATNTVSLPPDDDATGAAGFTANFGTISPTVADISENTPAITIPITYANPPTMIGTAQTSPTGTSITLTFAGDAAFGTEYAAKFTVGGTDVPINSATGTHSLGAVLVSQNVNLVITPVDNDADSGDERVLVTLNGVHLYNTGDGTAAATTNSAATIGENEAVFFLQDTVVPAPSFMDGEYEYTVVGANSGSNAFLQVNFPEIFGASDSDTTNILPGVGAVADLVLVYEGHGAGFFSARTCDEERNYSPGDTIPVSQLDGCDDPGSGGNTREGLGINVLPGTEVRFRLRNAAGLDSDLITVTINHPSTFNVSAGRSPPALNAILTELGLPTGTTTISRNLLASISTLRVVGATQTGANELQASDLADLAHVTTLVIEEHASDPITSLPAGYLNSPLESLTTLTLPSTYQKAFMGFSPASAPIEPGGVTRISLQLRNEANTAPVSSPVVIIAELDHTDNLSLLRAATGSIEGRRSLFPRFTPGGNTAAYIGYDATHTGAANGMVEIVTASLAVEQTTTGTGQNDRSGVLDALVETGNANGLSRTITLDASTAPARSPRVTLTTDDPAEIPVGATATFDLTLENMPSCRNIGDVNRYLTGSACTGAGGAPLTGHRIGMNFPTGTFAAPFSAGTGPYRGDVDDDGTNDVEVSVGIFDSTALVRNTILLEFVVATGDLDDRGGITIPVTFTALAETDGEFTVEFPDRQIFPSPGAGPIVASRYYSGQQDNAYLTFATNTATAELTLATPGDGIEGETPTAGGFILTLDDVPDVATPINYTILMQDGDAIPGVDYTLSATTGTGTVVFSAPVLNADTGNYNGSITVNPDAINTNGDATINFVVTPIDDNIVEGDEPVRLTLPDGIAGVEYTATATAIDITDDDNAIAVVAVNGITVSGDVDITLNEGLTYPVQIFLVRGTNREIDTSAINGVPVVLPDAADFTLMLEAGGGLGVFDAADASLAATVLTIPAGTSNAQTTLTVHANTDASETVTEQFELYISGADETTGVLFPRVVVPGDGDTRNDLLIAQSTLTGLCAGRTPAIRTAILAAVNALDTGSDGDEDCSNLDADDLSHTSFTELDLSGVSPDLTALQPGDFAGLTRLTTLGLNSNNIRVLPATVFDPLVALTSLTLAGNELTNSHDSIPENVFDNLAALTTLNLGNMSTLTGLPDNVLDDVLDTLATLTLDAAAQRFVTFAEPNEYEIVQDGETTVRLRITNTAGQTATTPTAVFVTLVPTGGSGLTVPVAVTAPGSVSRNGIIIPAGSNGVDVTISAADDAATGTPATLGFSSTAAETLLGTYDETTTTFTTSSRRPGLITLTANSASDPITASVNIVAPVQMMASDAVGNSAAVRNNVPGAIDLTLNRRDTDVGTVDVSFGLSGGLAVGVDYTLDITRPDDSENGAPVRTGGTGNGLTGEPLTLADSATSGTFRLPDGASSATFTITPIASSPLRTADSSVIIEITTVDYNGDADPDAVSQTTPPEATVDVAGYNPAPALAITPSSEDGNDGANGVNTQITEGLGSDDYAQFTVALTNAPNGEAVVTYNLAVSGQTDSVAFSGATSAITGVTFLDNIDGEVPTIVGNGQEFTMDVASGGAMGSLRFSARAGDGDRVNETVTLTITDVAFADNGDGTDISTSMLGEIRVIDSNQIDNICSRTDAVEARILAAVRTARSNGTLPCTDVMGNAPELSSIGSLTVTDVPGLLADDFAGLTGMTTLSLTGTFPTLPAGVFDQPTALTDLTINGALTSIPPGVFDRLTRLATLDLSGNDLRSVSGAVFGSTNTLQTLRILNLSGSTSLDITAGTLDAVLPRLTSLTWPTTRTASFDNVPTDISQTGTAPITVTLGDTNTLPVAVRIPITGNGPLSSTLTIPDAVIPAGTTSVVVIIAADTVVGTSGTISLGTPVLQTTPTAGDPADITTQNAGVRTALLRDPSGSQTLTFIEVTGPTARLTGSADTTLTRGDTATISVNLSNIDTIQNFTHVEVIMELGGTGIAGDLALVDADSVETSDYRIDITSGNVELTPGPTEVFAQAAGGSPPAALYVYVPVARFVAGVGGDALGAETINYTLTVKDTAGFSRTLMPSLRFASNGTSAVQAVDANGEPIAMGDIAVSGTAPTYTIVAPATFEPASANISEGSSETITLRLHNGANAVIPYTVTSTSVNGVEPADYTITTNGASTWTTGTTSGTFVFANDADEASINVHAVQDFAVDTAASEGLTITLGAGTHPPGNGFTITEGEVSTTLTIVSTDATPTTVSLSSTTAEIFESGSNTSTSITVSLNAPALADASIEVGYTIADVTAVINEDYRVTGDCDNLDSSNTPPTCPATGTITFTEGMVDSGARGIMSRTITFTALEDDVDESDTDEDFTFTLTSGDGTVNLGSPTEATITIRERTVELEEVMMQVETVATVVATEHVSALTSLIRQRFSATSSFASPPRVPTGGIPAPSTTTNLSLADSPETMNDMINSMGLERSAQGDSNDHYAVWIRGQRSAFEGTPEVQGLTVNYDGTSTGVGMGAEYISGGYLMGLAMNYVTTEVDLSTEGGVGSESITKYDESIVIAAPYLSMKAGEGTSLWASVGYGTGTADAKLEDETKSADVSLSFLNAGADFTVIGRGFEVVTGLSGLVVRKVVDAFVFADTVIPKTTIDTMQAVGEVTIYRPIPIAGQFVRPYMGISTIHDLGDIVADDDHGLGIRTGVAFGVGRISADIELSSELLRENRRQWTVSGGARFAARPGGQGLSLSLDGTQETQMDAGESVSDDVARTWGVGLEGGYGMPAGLFHPNGLLTPFASIDQTGNGRGMSGGVRFSVGNGLSLDLETTKQMHDDGEDASENKAGLRGQWSF